MEIIEATTIEELSNRIKSLNISPETLIRVVIERIEKKNDLINSGKNYLFLNEDIWDGEKTPKDLAERHDHYLYNEINK